MNEVCLSARGKPSRCAPASAGEPQELPAGRKSGRAIERCLIVLLVLSAGGGMWGHSRYGYAGWSPLGIVIVLLLVLWLTGNFR